MSGRLAEASRRKYAHKKFFGLPYITILVNADIYVWLMVGNYSKLATPSGMAAVIPTLLPVCLWEVFEGECWALGVVTSCGLFCWEIGLGAGVEIDMVVEIYTQGK